MISTMMNTAASLKREVYSTLNFSKHGGTRDSAVRQTSTLTSTSQHTKKWKSGKSFNWRRAHKAKLIVEQITKTPHNGTPTDSTSACKLSPIWSCHRSPAWNPARKKRNHHCVHRLRFPFCSAQDKTPINLRAVLAKWGDDDLKRPIELNWQTIVVDDRVTAKYSISKFPEPWRGGIVHTSGSYHSSV